MKNNKFLFLVLLASVGCSKSKDYPTLFSQLEKKSVIDEQVVAREVAAAPVEQCLKDRFTVDMLKAEVKELEKKFSSGTKVTGKWKHLNLADLPIPQANFLSKYGNQLGDLNNPDAYDYSHCSDVPCVFNTIYEKPDNQAGYVHYLWYLRMGHLLGASNKVHGATSQTKPGVYNGKNFAVSAYLYRDREIFAYWRLMKMLKAPHTELGDLKEIFRVPQGEYFDSDKNKSPTGSHTCGLAYSTGYVIMQDLCMTVDSNWEGGSFYDSVLHELTHQVDYHQGRKKGEAYRSDDQDYLDVSKFYLKEYKDAKGETVRQWDHKPGIKLVTSYAGTSPAENFAETIANYRVEGTLTKSMVTDEHYTYTGKNYFFSKDFEKKNMINGWLLSEGPLLNQLIFKAVGECSNSSKVTASTYFKKTDFDIVVLPSMLNCLGSKIPDISRDVRIKLKANEMEGCQILTEYNIRTEWEPALKPAIVKIANKYLKELQTDKAYFARVQKFIDNIPKRDMANEAFLSCLDKATEDQCYKESVTKLALANLETLNLPESQTQDLAELYLNGHPIEDTRAYLLSYYKSFVLSHGEQIEQDASDMYAKCLSAPLNDDVPPSGRHFSIGDGYMVSSIYNCINTDFPETAKLIVRNLAVGEMKVQHPKEEVILYEQVVPELKKSLEMIYNKKRAAEAKEVAAFIASDEGKIRNSVVNDFSWVKDVLSTEKIQKDCRKQALDSISFELKYQTRGDAFGALADTACNSITESSQYTKWLDDSKSDFAAKSVSGLEKTIVEIATAKAATCLTQFPVDTNLNRIKFKKEREACLVDAWPSIEASALKEFEKDPIVVKFHVDVEAVKSQLEGNRRRLQIRVIKENF